MIQNHEVDELFIELVAEIGAMIKVRSLNPLGFYKDFFFNLQNELITDGYISETNKILISMMPKEDVEIERNTMRLVVEAIVKKKNFRYPYQANDFFEKLTGKIFAKTEEGIFQADIEKGVIWYESKIKKVENSKPLYARARVNMPAHEWRKFLISLFGKIPHKKITIRYKRLVIDEVRKRKKS